MKNWSLRFKVTAIVVATTFLVMTLTFLVISRLQMRKSLDEMKRHSAILGESIQGAVSRAVAASEDSRRHLQKMTLEIAKTDGIKEVEIFDENMTIIAHNNPDRVGDRFSVHMPLIQRVWNTGQVQNVIEENEFIRIIPVFIGPEDNAKIGALLELVIDGEAAQSKNLLEVTSQTTLKIIEKAIGDSIRSRKDLQALTQDLGQLQDIDHIEVFDSTRTIIAHTSPDQIGGKASEHSGLVNQVFETGRVVEHEEWEEHKYERYIPIKKGKGLDSPTIAVAEVAFTTKPVIASLRDFDKTILILSLGLSLLLAILLTYVLRRTITKRIFSLSRLAIALSSGKLTSRAVIHSSDEIGQLGKALNKMAEKLAEARASVENKLEVQKELDKLKDNFLAVVSHELRTPLTAVVGLSDAMLEGYMGQLNPEQKNTLKKIQQQGEHLHSLINNILDLESIHAGRMNMEIQKASLQSLVDQAVMVCALPAEKKGVEITNLVELNLEPFMMDAVKVKSIISNLIGNAVKFTPAGGEIEVSSGVMQNGPDQTYVEIMVSDNGIGIPSEEREKIFNRFYQVQDGADRDASGVGLGLVLARSFAMAHGGWLNLKERPGWSTTFSFGIPVKMEKPARSLTILKTRFPLPPMLLGIIQMLEEEKGSELGIQISWPDPVSIEEIEADREYLRSILINILQNSIRYRREGTPIHIVVGTNKQKLEIAIENEGPPLPEEKIAEILTSKGENGQSSQPNESFFSLHATYEILRSHGGALEIENITKAVDGNSKTGVRFTIRIPNRALTAATRGGDLGEEESPRH